jgi:hypothetical protein
LAINGDTGLLVAIVIAIALAFDFILLPPLLMLLDREKQEPHQASAITRPIDPPARIRTNSS